MSHDLLAAYALDAVDPAERVDVEQHLADCAECPGLLTALRTAVTAFAEDGIVPVEPPTSMRASVLIQIAPDVRRLRLPADGGGEIMAVVSVQLSQGVVTLRGLPSGGKTHSYQLWLIRDGRPESAGVFPPGIGDGTHVIDGVRGAAAVGLTREPPGGSATPTLPILAALSL